MSEQLLSVGLDVGTTSTQLAVSRLRIENRASGFAVPEMEITDREILYRSPVYFTPLVEEKLVDGNAIREIVEKEYEIAGISREQVDSGAIIITGETSRKENARTVLSALSEFAGDFVVATAGPDLESVLAAKGSGAVDYSERTGQTVLHMDIGGGTSNLALIQEGRIVRTGCLNVGGRLVKFHRDGKLSYVSPAIGEIFPLKPGDIPNRHQREALAETLAEALEMAAGRREATELLPRLTTKETGRSWMPPEKPVVVSFSGGVADCIAENHPEFVFGDLGPLLGKKIRESRLCREAYVLGDETIRATVIGAGCHSTQLSGSTVFYRNVAFPLKNVPVVHISDISAVQEILAQQEVRPILALAGKRAPSYREVADLADSLAAQITGPLLICLEQDMAKALGHALAVRLGPEVPLLCIDRVRVEEGSYLDIGEPVDAALPVVVKTLVLSKQVKT